MLIEEGTDPYIQSRISRIELYFSVVLFFFFNHFEK
jgi:hypothetical protein